MSFTQTAGICDGQFAVSQGVHAQNRRAPLSSDEMTAASVGAQLAVQGDARTVEVCVRLVRDEKLAGVGVGPAVCHGHDAALAVLQRLHQLVWELAIRRRVNALATLASSCKAVTILDHQRTAKHF